jgi:hypothetical protein
MQPDDTAFAIEAQRDALERVTWHGSATAGRRLVRAIRRYCNCHPSSPLCAAHAVILDQRALDGLLFARYLAPRLRAQEFSFA